MRPCPRTCHFRLEAAFLRYRQTDRQTDRVDKLTLVDMLHWPIKLTWWSSRRCDCLRRSLWTFWAKGLENSVLCIICPKTFFPCSFSLFTCLYTKDFVQYHSPRILKNYLWVKYKFKSYENERFASYLSSETCCLKYAEKMLLYSLHDILYAAIIVLPALKIKKIIVNVSVCC
jgi:hypothetical protein